MIIPNTIGPVISVRDCTCVKYESGVCTISEVIPAKSFTAKVGLGEWPSHAPH